MPYAQSSRARRIRRLGLPALRLRVRPSVRPVRDTGDTRIADSGRRNKYITVPQRHLDARSKNMIRSGNDQTATKVQSCACGFCRPVRPARDFDLGGGFHYSGSFPMVFQHSGARDFDLGGGFHYSGSYPMVFQHSAPGPRDPDRQCKLNCVLCSRRPLNDVPDSRTHPR